jgi:hypothetical protein
MGRCGGLKKQDMRIYKRRVVAENVGQDLVPLHERIEHYLDACPPAISGQRGHNALFKVAIILVRGFDLSQEAALPFLRRYNTRCQPPWNEDELKHKLSSAANLQPREGRTLNPRGYLL